MSLLSTDSNLSQNPSYAVGPTVAKFGGTSVADYDAMSRCANIVCQNYSIKVVVVSASAGVTNHLVELSQNALLSNARRDEMLQDITNIQEAILKRLCRPAQLAQDIEDMLSALRELAFHPCLTLRRDLRDEILSFGERLSSALFAEVIRQRGFKTRCFDARKVMATNSDFGNAIPDVAQIKALTEEHLMPVIQNELVITQGFIGAEQHGLTTTLGRGGSDYTAALLAESIGASVLEIWTDVSGIYTTDPRVCDQAQPITEISFSEAAEMATFGAKVLHPATLMPAMRNDINVFVGCSSAPKKGGTWILRNVQNRPRYRAIALRKTQTLVTVSSPNMLHASGFLAKVFGVLSEYNISVDLITTSEISVALTLDNVGGEEAVLPAACISALEAYANVEIETGLALVAVIGQHTQTARQTGGIDPHMFQALKGVNLRMICHGASENNLCFLVNEQQAEQTVQALHEQLLYETNGEAAAVI